MLAFQRAAYERLILSEPGLVSYWPLSPTRKETMLPSSAQIRQFLVGTIIPPIAGVAATWIVGTHVLALFPIGKSQVAYAVTQVITFGVVTGLTWLTSHHVLTGSYAPNTPAVPPIGGTYVSR